MKFRITFVLVFLASISSFAAAQQAPAQHDSKAPPVREAQVILEIRSVMLPDERMQLLEEKGGVRRFPRMDCCEAYDRRQTELMLTVAGGVRGRVPVDSTVTLANGEKREVSLSSPKQSGIVEAIVSDDRQSVEIRWTAICPDGKLLSPVTATIPVASSLLIHTLRLEGLNNATSFWDKVRDKLFHDRSGVGNLEAFVLVTPRTVSPRQEGIQTASR
jgi:hypothetical protein